MVQQPRTTKTFPNLAIFPRVRIHNKLSRYDGDLGHIVGSSADGFFMVTVAIEGEPCILLPPSQVEPC